MRDVGRILRELRTDRKYDCLKIPVPISKIQMEPPEQRVLGSAEITSTKPRCRLFLTSSKRRVFMHMQRAPISFLGTNAGLCIRTCELLVGACSVPVNAPKYDTC